MPRPLSARGTYNETHLATKLAFGLTVAIATLVFGGHWLQNVRTDLRVAELQSQAYASYQAHTQTAATETLASPQAAQPVADDLRSQLLQHPAVTPGRGFEQPSVQATAKTILDAIARAQGSSI